VDKYFHNTDGYQSEIEATLRGEDIYKMKVTPILTSRKLKLWLRLFNKKTKSTEKYISSAFQ